MQKDIEKSGVERAAKARTTRAKEGNGGSKYLQTAFLRSNFLLFALLTLYKLHVVPVRICSTFESYRQYLWVISSVPVRVCSTRESYHQSLQFISSVPVRMCITRESYPQYLWGYAEPVSHILSTCNSYPQYPWRYALAMSRILSTCEGMQYPWVISSVPAIHILSTHEDMH